MVTVARPHKLAAVNARRVAFGLGLLLLPYASGWAQSPAPAPTSATATEGGKGIPLIALLAPRAAEALSGAFFQGASCVFRRLLSFTGARLSPECMTDEERRKENTLAYGGAFGGAYGGNYGGNYGSNSGGANPNSTATNVAVGSATCGVPGAPACQSPQFDQATQALGAGSQSGTGALSRDQAELFAAQPIIPLTIFQMSSHQPQAVKQRQLLTQNLKPGEPASFTIETQQSYAVQFAATVPGRAQLVQTDSFGESSASDVYEVVPGTDDLMPRAYQGAVLMTGKPGLETLSITFTPCVSSALRNHPQVAPFVGVLPACEGAAAVKGIAVKPGSLPLGGKGGLFPSSSMNGQAVGIANKDYVKGQTLTFVVNIDHRPAP